MKALLSESFLMPLFFSAPMNTLLMILLATFINGLVAFVGIFSIGLSNKLFKKLIFVFVAFSAGALLSGAFFHIIPEALDELPAMQVSLFVLTGFVVFFLIERVLHWHHCHEEGCKTHDDKEHPITMLILFGDSIHNFVDGIIISAGFIASVPLGILTTLMIIAHEIPQELGDFAVLVHGGFSKKKALMYNFFSQLTSVVGGVVGFFFATLVKGMIPIVLSFAAGGFIYIAASDLIPELHKEPKLKKALLSFFCFIAGLGLMLLMKIVFEG